MSKLKAGDMIVKWTKRLGRDERIAVFTGEKINVDVEFVAIVLSTQPSTKTREVMVETLTYFAKDDRTVVTPGFESTFVADLAHKRALLLSFTGADREGFFTGCGRARQSTEAKT